MNVGQAILFDGESLIIKELHDNGMVTLRDLNGACRTVGKDGITEV